jgi:signal transduction histidine kinase
VKRAGWLSALGSIPYRELLNTPGIARAHDLQRIVSYGLGVVVGLLVDLPAWRTIPVLVIASVSLLAAIERTVSGRKVAPYLLAQTDQLLATVAIAVATASPVITAAVVVFITAAIVASFAAPTRIAVAAAVITGSPGLVTAVIVGSRSDEGVVDYVAALVLILLMIALASFILGFFTIQARQLRRELDSREIQLSAVLEVTPVVLATVDRTRTLTMLAGDLPAWGELSGTKLAKGCDLDQVVAAANTGQRATADIALADRTFMVTCDPGDSGKTLLTAVDVTEQTEARRRLEELVRSKDQFIAAVSHELRTPLSSVLGFAEVVQEAMDGTDPLRLMMGEVADQSAEMAAIIDDLLVAARSSFEEVPTAPRMVDLGEEAAAVVDTVGPRLASSPDCQLGDAAAYADPIRVRQIIRNLLTNADRYGGDHIVVHTRTDGPQSVLEVRDSGSPLAPEFSDRIFDPYESSGPVRGQPAAIGLGLAVSRTLAVLMEGSLEYRHDGEWSVFELRLPGQHALQDELFVADMVEQRSERLA